jgi:hypothetical protein
LQNYLSGKSFSPLPVENIDRGCRNRNIYILSDSQAAINALDNYQINSKLVWPYQFLAQLAEHKEHSTDKAARSQGY